MAAAVNFMEWKLNAVQINTINTLWNAKLLPSLGTRIKLWSLYRIKNWNHKNLIGISSYFQVVHFTRKQSVYEEGDYADSAYIIKSGEVELIKTVPQIEIKHKNIGKYGRPIYFPVIMPKKNQKLYLCVKGELEVFGDDEITKDISRQYSCRCHSSACTLLKISRADFKKMGD